MTVFGHPCGPFLSRQSYPWRRRPVVFCIHGNPLPGNIYPLMPVLFRRTKVGFRQDGHAHRVQVEGAHGRFRSRLLLDDRKPITHWAVSQSRYAYLEACKLRDTPPENLSLTSRIRRLKWVSPILVPLYSLIVKRCIFAGSAGLVYAAQRLVFELLVMLYLDEFKRTGRGTCHS